MFNEFVAVGGQLLTTIHDVTHSIIFVEKTD